jgi:hypothetical protein
VTNSVRKSRTAVKGGPGLAGLRVDAATGRFVITRKALGTTEEVVQVRAKAPTAKTAAFTVAFPEDDGKVFKLALLASITVTLPAVSLSNQGCRVTFVNTLLPTSGVGYSISPAAADNIKYGVDDKDIVNVVASDALGDLVTLVSDGVDGWIVTEQVGTWTKEA